MAKITTKTASVESDIFYQDLGTGQPVVLIHGWPMSHRMWEPQVPVLHAAGFRTVAYDRRGFGHSGFPDGSFAGGGYEYDTLADDLHDLMTELDLRDAVLVGFSMGGGEVARYLSRHGTDRVARVALVSSVTPFLMQTPDNPDGAPQEVFAGMLRDMTTDRPAFLQSFAKQFFNDGLLTHPVSQGVLDYAFAIASMAQPLATVECARAFAATDFRAGHGRLHGPDAHRPRQGGPDGADRGLGRPRGHDAPRGPLRGPRGRAARPLPDAHRGLQPDPAGLPRRRRLPSRSPRRRPSRAAARCSPPGCAGTRGPLRTARGGPRALS